jgi:hypothetical protein
MAYDEIPTIKIQSSQAVARADGRVAIVLVGQGVGPIAFEVTLETIPLLRAEISKAEQALRQHTGNA